MKLPLICIISLRKNDFHISGVDCTWKTDPLYFELKEDVKPICSIPYLVPKLHKQMFKKEVEHLVLLEFLEKTNDSEWAAPYFGQPKPKTLITLSN